MYVDGHVDIFDMVDINLFTVVALNMMVVQLGYTGKFKHLFYNYLRPLTSLDEGLYALACKKDVHCLATLVRSFKWVRAIEFSGGHRVSGTIGHHHSVGQQKVRTGWSRVAGQSRLLVRVIKRAGRDRSGW
ncbi:hypothetical protein Tco_1408333 [Tanacetum coccineum]